LAICDYVIDSIACRERWIFESLPLRHTVRIFASFLPIATLLRSVRKGKAQQVAKQGSWRERDHQCVPKGKRWLLDVNF
jgi:hypothetical protein